MSEDFEKIVLGEKQEELIRCIEKYLIGRFEEKDFMCQVFESLLEFTPKKMARLRGNLGQELFNLYLKYG